MNIRTYNAELSGFLGLPAASILAQLEYWLKRSKNVIEGRTWVYNTYEEWAEQFPWAKPRTLRAIFCRLETLGIVISARLEAHNWNQRKWYSIDYTMLETFIIQRRQETNSQFVIEPPLKASSSGSSNTKNSTKFKKEQQTAEKDQTDVFKELIPTLHPVLEVNKKDNLVNPEDDCKGIDEYSAEPEPQNHEAKTIEPELEQQLVQAVGHNLSSSLKLLIANATTSDVQDALTILQTGKNIKNKAGLLRRAIENKWKPSPAVNQNKNSLDPNFDQWWTLAKAQNLVIGSELIDGQLWIYDAQAKAITYQKMLELYPLESLKPNKSPQVRSAQPLDLSDLLSQIDIQFARLGWVAVQIQQFLLQIYGKASRALLDDQELSDLHSRLQTL